jgi:hypothetical protein
VAVVVALQEVPELRELELTAGQVVLTVAQAVTLLQTWVAVVAALAH